MTLIEKIVALGISSAVALAVTQGLTQSTKFSNIFEAEEQINAEQANVLAWIHRVSTAKRGEVKWHIDQEGGQVDSRFINDTGLRSFCSDFNFVGETILSGASPASYPSAIKEFDEIKIGNIRLASVGSLGKVKTNKIELMQLAPKVGNQFGYVPVALKFEYSVPESGEGTKSRRLVTRQIDFMAKVSVSDRITDCVKLYYDQLAEAGKTVEDPKTRDEACKVLGGTWDSNASTNGYEFTTPPCSFEQR